jgi:hypothetical protein
MTEAEIEVERCHRALDRIYEHLRILEPTLSKEQVALCPIVSTKWWKHPEWEEHDAYLLSESGRSAEVRQLAAREENLKVWSENREK